MCNAYNILFLLASISSVVQNDYHRWQFEGKCEKMCSIDLLGIVAVAHIANAVNNNK